MSSSRRVSQLGDLVHMKLQVGKSDAVGLNGGQGGHEVLIILFGPCSLR